MIVAGSFLVQFSKNWFVKQRAVLVSITGQIILVQNPWRFNHLREPSLKCKWKYVLAGRDLGWPDKLKLGDLSLNAI